MPPFCSSVPPFCSSVLLLLPLSNRYAPILGFFAVTGLPTAGFLFYKSVQTANAEADRMDKLDGY